MQKDREYADPADKMIFIAAVSVVSIVALVVGYALHGNNQDDERNDKREIIEVEACAAENDMTSCMLITAQIDECSDLDADGEVAACLEDINVDGE